MKLKAKDYCLVYPAEEYPTKYDVKKVVIHHGTESVYKGHTVRATKIDTDDGTARVVIDDSQKEYTALLDNFEIIDDSPGAEIIGWKIPMKEQDVEKLDRWVFDAILNTPTTLSPWVDIQNPLTAEELFVAAAMLKPLFMIPKGFPVPEELKDKAVFRESSCIDQNHVVLVTAPGIKRNMLENFYRELKENGKEQ